MFLINREQGQILRLFSCEWSTNDILYRQIIFNQIYYLEILVRLISGTVHKASLVEIPDGASFFFLKEKVLYLHN